MVHVNEILAELRAGRPAALERVREAIVRWADALDEDYVVEAGKIVVLLEELNRLQGEREAMRLH